MSRLITAISMVTLTVLAFAQPALSADDSPQEKTIRQMIADLNDDAFIVRESATRQLAVLGKSAAPLLGEAAQAGKPETAWRAIFALREMALLGDGNTSEVAERQLARLKLSDNFAVSDYAGDCLIDLPSLRQTRAVERLRELGAKFDASFPTTVRLDGQWTGGDQGVSLLRHLAELTQINVEPGTQVSDEALARLRDEHPKKDLQVTRFGEAFLGVGTDNRNLTNLPGLPVTSVVADGPAGKAGLQADDLITAIDGTAIRDFQELVKSLRGKRVGDTVTISYLRGGDEKSGKAVLGARPGVQK